MDTFEALMRLSALFVMLPAGRVPTEQVNMAMVEYTKYRESYNSYLESFSYFLANLAKQSPRTN